MSKILVRVEDVVCGDTAGPDGVMFEVWLYPITADVTIKNAMPQEDFFQIFSDEGYKPLEYTDLILDEAQAYLFSEFGLTVPQHDLLLLGFNDFLWAGVDSVALEEEFSNSSVIDGQIGRYGWRFAIGGSGLANGSLVSINSFGGGDHPGLLQLRTGANATGGAGNDYANLYFPQPLSLAAVDRFNFVYQVKNANADASWQVGFFVNAPTGALGGSGSSAKGLQAYYQAGEVTIKLRTADNSGLQPVDNANTYLANKWMSFSGVRSSYLPGDPYTTTWELSSKNLSDGTETSASVQLVLNSGDLFYPQFWLRKQVNAQQFLDVDYFSCRVRDLERVGVEF